MRMFTHMYIEFDESARQRYREGTFVPVHIAVERIARRMFGGDLVDYIALRNNKGRAHVTLNKDPEAVTSLIQAVRQELGDESIKSWGDRDRESLHEPDRFQVKPKEPAHLEDITFFGKSHRDEGRHAKRSPYKGIPKADYKESERLL